MKNTVAALMAAVSLTAFASQAQAEQVYNPYIGINYNYSDANAKGLRPYYNSGSVNLSFSISFLTSTANPARLKNSPTVFRLMVWI